MSAKLEQFFDKATKNLDLAKNISGRVGTAPLEPVTKKFSLKKARIGDLPVQVNRQISAGVQIFAVNKAVSVFDFGDPGEPKLPTAVAGLPALPGSVSAPEEAKPPSKHAFAELLLSIGAGASAAMKAPMGQALALSAAASASGEIRYRLLLAAPETALKTKAIGDLLLRARPPQQLDLRGISPNELHTFDARFQLGFQIKAEMGQEFDFSEVLDLFDEMSLEIKAHAEATLSASLGWSLYERIQIAVGKMNLASDDPQWVRIRIQRLRRRELTLGAKLAVQVDYDLGKKTFEALLDRILELEPIDRLFGFFDEVEELGLDKARSQADWDAIRSKLSAELADTIVDYVDAGALIDQLPWGEVEIFVKDIAKLVAEYRRWDEKVQSLLQSLLGRFDLEEGSPIREALSEIAGLDSTDLDSVLSKVAGPDFQDAVELLELLSGSSVEELILDSRAKGFIDEAANLAGQVAGFLDDLDDDVVGRLEKFAENSGVEGLVSWLEENATSTVKLRNGLQKRADSKIRSLVGRLFGKTWNQLDNDDLARLRRWSEALVDLSKHKKQIEEKLGKAIGYLEGEIGFSVGIEVGRLTERAAILDLEVDSTNQKVRRIAESAMATMSARDLLEELPDPKGDANGETLGYRLRDSVFSYRRVRSTSISAVSSLFGINRVRQTVRIDEDTVRLQRANGVERQAVYSTGVVRRITDKGKKAYAGRHELGVWLTTRLEGPGSRLDAPYSSLIERELRVVYSRKDDKTLPGELAALSDVLTDLGFRLQAGSAMPTVPDDADAILTELSLSINFGEDAAKALFKNKTEDKWNIDYFNASHRWLDERLVPRKSGVGKPKPYSGELLSRVLEHDEFRKNWAKGLDLYLEIGEQPLNVRVGDHVYRVVLVTDKGSGRYTPLTRVLMNRSRSAKKLGQTVDAYKKAQADLEPEGLRLFGKRFATLVARTPFGGGWPSPLCNLWIVLARVAREDPSALAAARGLATLRFREDVAGDWETPIRWELKGANSGGNIFPF